MVASCLHISEGHYRSIAIQINKVQCMQINTDPLQYSTVHSYICNQASGDLQSFKAENFRIKISDSCLPKPNFDMASSSQPS